MGSSATTTTESPASSAGLSWFGPWQIGKANFGFLVLTVLAQAATIVITWDVWQVRSVLTDHPNVPWFPTLPQFDFGYLLIASLVLTLISPRHLGLWVHLLILTCAFLTDQLRCQPQIISIAVLMAACVFPSFKRIAIWYLIAMWFWAGLHKLLSPDWIGEVSYYLLLRQAFAWETFQAWDYHRTFAIVVAIAELCLGVLAWRCPKLAVPLCFLSHVGIAIFLIVVNWNFSVLPWNFCTAIVGAWLLWTFNSDSSSIALPASKTQRVAVILLLVTPIGFYFGWLRHSFCHVLYSANFPDAVITTAEGPEKCQVIEDLRVPFPHEQKAFLDLFRLTGKPGEKLHIFEHRRLLSTRYFVMNQNREIDEITRSEFMTGNNQSLPGIAFDDRRKLFQFDKEFHNANKLLKKDDPTIAKILKRGPDQMAWAIRFNPTTFNRGLLEHLDGFPNLEQVQLAGCDISDEDLRHIAGLIRLQGIGLNNTAITDAGLRHLEKLPQLATIEIRNTAITQDAVKKTIDRSEE